MYSEIIQRVLIFSHFLILMFIIIALGYIIIKRITANHEEAKQNWKFISIIVSELLAILFISNMMIFHNEILSYAGMIFVSIMLVTGIVFLKKHPEIKMKTISIKLKY